ncbi:MAG: hypothetical protein LBI28_13050 [Treponema sp.]|nr:hypothetical protein [Treponema sp.]
MKNIKCNIFLIVRVIILVSAILFFSSCGIFFAPYHTIFYENMELPVWTDSSGVWSYDDEKWFMRRLNDPMLNEFHNSLLEEREKLFGLQAKKRDMDIINKYYLNGALCYASIRAKNETTNYSRNPYSIGLSVYGFPNKHISYTIKKINVDSRSGNNLSHLADNELPVTIELHNESSSEEMLVRGYYRSEELFKLKKETIIIEFVLEINSVDGTEMGILVFELNPVEKFGLFQSSF